MYKTARIRKSASRPAFRRRPVARLAISGLLLLSYLVPLLAVMAMPAPASAQEAKLFADLRAGICSQRQPASEDPDQDSKFNGARANCVLCKHPASPAPDGLSARVWQDLAWVRVEVLSPPRDLTVHDQIALRAKPPRGPPLFSA